MAKFSFKANSEFETLTNEELHDTLNMTQRNFFREMARGLKHMQLQPQIGTVSGGNVTLPTIGSGANNGPQPGFVWAIQRLSAYGLRTNDILNVYRNTVDPQNFVGVLTNTSPMAVYGDKGFLLKDGDRLVFDGSALAATSVVVSGEFIECATIDIWKIIGGN